MSEVRPRNKPPAVKFRRWSVEKAYKACKSLPAGATKTLWVTLGTYGAECTVTVNPPRGNVEWLVCGVYTNETPELWILDDATTCARELLGIT